MLNIILFGPPGAGKGTQSNLLIDKFNLVHLSTGDIFRYNIKNETELGKTANSYIENGNLVPDEVTIGMVKDFLERHPDANGFIFDGFPRTIAQGEALDKMLAEKDHSIDLMLALEVEDEELIKRLLERGKTSNRADDQSEETIQNRLNVYKKETAPLAEYYSEQDKYMGVHGVGTIEEIFERLCAAIKMKTSS
ncbi:adenylate kinase [bacterium]|nr:adenylate kinase [bacterium]